MPRGEGSLCLAHQTGESLPRGGGGTTLREKLSSPGNGPSQALSNQTTSLGEEDVLRGEGGGPPVSVKEVLSALGKSSISRLRRGGRESLATCRRGDLVEGNSVTPEGRARPMEENRVAYFGENWTTYRCRQMFERGRILLGGAPIPGKRGAKDRH